MSGKIIVRGKYLYISMRGKRYSTGLTNTPENQLKAQAQLLEMQQGVREEAQKVISIKQAYSTFMAVKDYAPKTVRTFNQMMTYVVNGYTSQPASTTTFRKIAINYLSKTHHNNTSINIFLRHLTTFGNWCAKEYGWKEKPSIRELMREEEPQENKVYSLNEVHKLHSYMSNKEFADLILLMAYTGGRFTETVTLRFSDIIDDRIYFPSKKRRRKLNYVPLNSVSTEIIKRCKERHPHGQRLFKWEASTQSRLARWLKTACLACDIEYKPFHSLRKSFVTHLLNEGVSLDLVQKLARHASIQTTLKHYRAIEDKALTETMDSALKLNKSEHTNSKNG